MNDLPAPERTDEDLILGIDLGTTHSLIAYCDEAGPRILASPEGERMLPSVVRLSPATGQALVIGSQARRHAVEYPQTTIHSVKRLMGRSVADLGEEVEHLPYPLVEGEHQTARVVAGEHALAPQQISAMILSELRRWGEAALERPVRKVVVTVPAYFDDAQRQATRDAGRIAGLEVVRMVNEPTAAALAYGLGLRAPARSKPTSAIGRLPEGGLSLNTQVNPQACQSGAVNAAGSASHAPAQAQTIAVFDLGGGTFDVSLLRLEQTPQGSIDQVLATAGDTHLGGDDVDQAIMGLMEREVADLFGEGKVLRLPPEVRQAFRTLAEEAKKRLSTEQQVPIEIDLGSGRVYRRELKREELEKLVEPWLEKALACCRRVLDAAGLVPQAIDRVVLVGGATRMPCVRSAVAGFFGTEPYAALNPDEVVALGAAVQGSILAGVNRQMLLLDVIPLSLGIETMGGAVAKLIMANQTIPARATEQFSTYVDGQTSVRIHVLQGERELVEDCRSLGHFDLAGIPPMPAGLPKLEVTFLVDANGILNVQAIEQRSGRRASIQVIPNHGLTREEVVRMEVESLQYAVQDMQTHRLIDLKMNAQLDIRHIRRQMERVADVLEPDYRQEIEEHIHRVEAFIGQGAEADADAFHQALTAMDHATIRLAEMNITRTLKER